jgi:hypothetical protein
MNLPFAVLPKTAKLFQPPKASFNYPPLGQYRKPMQFIAFHHLSPYKQLHGLGEVFSPVSAITLHFRRLRQVWSATP